MFTLSRTPVLAAAAAALALMGAPAMADAKCPPGQAKKGNCVQTQAPGKAHGKAKAHGKDKPAPRAEAKPAHKPAVAAAAAAAAVPLALRDDDAIRIGDTLGVSRYLRIADPAVFGLPVLRDGSAYYLVGNRIVRADSNLVVREELRRVDPKVDCPPGLAKKEPACIPPGQAKKLMRGEWSAAPVPLTAEQIARLALPAPDGAWQYAVVDGTLVRLDPTTRTVLSIIRLIDSL